jgi:hypothetical protein
MKMKLFLVLALVVAFAVSFTAVSAEGAGPYDQPPSLTIKSGKKKVKSSGKFVLGKATCGTGTCSATKKKVTLVVAGKSYKVKVTIGSIPAGATHKIKCKAKSAGVNALKKAGKGKVKFNIRVASSNGLAVAKKGTRKAVPA